MQATVTITDADRRVDYTLAVACDFLRGSPARCGWLEGGEPGEAPAVEINDVRCLEIAVWCGRHAVSGWPGSDERRSLEATIGRWCLDEYQVEIEQAVLELISKHDALYGPGGD